MEGPQPPVPLADRHAGLIRLQHAAGEQTGADQAPLPGEGRPAVGQHGDQGAFADRKPEQIGHQPADAVVFEPDHAGLIGLAGNGAIEPRPALGRDFALQDGSNLKVALRTEFRRDEVLGARPHAARDVVPADHKVLAIIDPAADQQVDMGIIGVPVLDRDPVEPGLKVLLHVGEEVAGERLEVSHLDSFLGADNESEMMPIPTAALGKGRRVGGVAFGIEQPGVPAVSGHSLALEISDVSGKRGRAERSTAVAGDARLDDDPAR